MPTPSRGPAAFLFIAACLAAPAALANSSGLIIFNGQLTDATCDVRGGLAGTPSFVVDLPTISAQQLTPGAVAGRTLFRMALQNCSAVQNGVRVFFEGGPEVDPATGTLRTAVPDVHFALFNPADGAQLAIGHETQRNDNPLYQVDDVMHYEVAYQNVGLANATAGLVAASVVYSLHYP